MVSGEGALYRELFNTWPVAIALLDNQQRWVDVNLAFCHLLNLPRADILNRPFTDFFQPGSALLNAWMPSFPCRYIGLDWVQRSDGVAQQVRYDLQFQAVASHHRLVLSLPSEGTDESRRLPLAQTTDQLSCWPLNPAHGLMAVMQAESEQDWQLVFVSAGCEALYGYGAEALMASPGLWRSRILPEDWETRIRPALKRLITQISKTETVIYRFRHRNGHVRRIVAAFQRDPLAAAEHRLVRIEWDVSGLSPAQFHSPVPDLAQSASPLATQQDHILHHISRGILSSLELETLFETVTTELGRLLNLDRVDVTHYFPQDSEWRTVAAYRQSEQLRDTYGLRLADEHHVFAAVLRRFEIAQVQDFGAAIATAAPQLPSKIPDALAGAWLLVPLQVPVEVDGVRSHHLWGSLGLNCRNGGRYWHDQEIELIQRVAEQLAIGIQKSELHRALHRLNSHLDGEVQNRTQQLQRAVELEALLRRISEKVRSSLDPRQILQTIVQEVGHTLNASGCDVALFDFEANQLEVSFEYLNDPQLPSAQGKVLPLNQDLLTFPRPLQPVQHCPLYQNDLRPLGVPYVVLSCLIADDQQILGDMWVWRRCEEPSFSPAEIRLAYQVANQCAIALRQARLFQAAQHQVEELERINHLKDDFLSTVSHELRTPISNINMATQMLELLLFRDPFLAESEPPVLSLAPDGSQKLQHYFRILKEECQREIALINDLLDLSRLEAQAEPSLPTQMDLSAWIQHLIHPFQARAQKHQRRFCLDLPDSYPFVTDLNFLERLIAELLNNACKYTPPGETIALALHPQTPQQCQICISNTGIEISPAEQERVFEKFYRVPSNDPWKHPGTGLGLALVKQLAETLGGSIALESGDRLTRFILTLPTLTLPESGTLNS